MPRIVPRPTDVARTAKPPAARNTPTTRRRHRPKSHKPSYAAPRRPGCLAALHRRYEFSVGASARILRLPFVQSQRFQEGHRSQPERHDFCPVPFLHDFQHTTLIWRIIVRFDWGCVCGFRKKACGTPKVLARSKGAAASGRPVCWRVGVAIDSSVRNHPTQLSHYTMYRSRVHLQTHEICDLCRFFFGWCPARSEQEDTPYRPRPASHSKAVERESDASSHTPWATVHRGRGSPSTQKNREMASWPPGFPRHCLSHM